MTARRRLVPDSEIRTVLDTLRDCGVAIGRVDVRADGVTVWPPGEGQPETDFDRWAQQDRDRERAAPRR